MVNSEWGRTRHSIHHLLFTIRRQFVADARADRLARDDADDVARRPHVEDDDGEVVVHAQADCRGVHHLQTLLKDFAVGDALEARRRGVFDRVGRVDAVDLRRLQNHVGLYLQGAKGGGRVGREVRVAGARGEDYDAPLLYVAYGAAAYEGLGDLRDVDGRQDARVAADLLKRVLQDDGVHDGGGHAYVVGARPVHVARALRDAAEDVAAADDDRDLDAQVVDGLYLFGYSARHAHVHAVALRAHQRLARSLQQNPSVRRPALRRRSRCAVLGVTHGSEINRGGQDRED